MPEAAAMPARTKIPAARTATAMMIIVFMPAVYHQPRIPQGTCFENSVQCSVETADFADYTEGEDLIFWPQVGFAGSLKRSSAA
jgi:hypothetical protein